MDRSRSHGLLAGVEFDYEVMEDELTCPVCLELFADPVLLPCSHSVCKKCLQDVCDSRLCDSTAKQQEVECPSCRHGVPLSANHSVSELPKNLALENIVIRYSEERSRSIRRSLSVEAPMCDHRSDDSSDRDPPESLDRDVSPRCEMCVPAAASAALWWCPQCGVLYCQPCVARYHPNKGPLSRHHLSRDLTSRSLTRDCPDHPGVTLSLVCDACHVAVCHVCVCDSDGRHAGHKVLLPKTATERLKLSVEETRALTETLLTRLTDQRAQLQAFSNDVQSAHTTACASVEAEYRRLVAAVTTALTLEKTRALGRLSEELAAVNSRLSDSVRERDNATSRLESVAKRCDQLVVLGDTELLGHGAELRPLRDGVEQDDKHTAVLGSEVVAMVTMKSLRSRVTAAGHTFTEGARDVLKLFTETTPETIVPVVKTPSSGRGDELSAGSLSITARGASNQSPRTSLFAPSSPGPFDSPPRGPPPLLTWGFSLSSFTAAPVSGSAQWTVTVERHKSGVTDSGLLFGAGVAAQPLGIRDCVGRTPGAWGLMCEDGQLTFTHGPGGEITALGRLEALPLTLTLAVHADHARYTALTYTLQTPGGAQIHGQTVLADPRLKETTFPVFSVSQRVKLLFPTYV